MQQKKEMKNKKGNNFGGSKLIYTTLIILALLVIIVLVLDKVDFSTNNKSQKANGNVELDTTNIAQLEEIADIKVNLVKFELTKPTNTYKFLLSDIKMAEDYSWKALNIDTTLSTSWERLGYINSHFHGDQALKRNKSYLAQNMPEKAKIAENEAFESFVKSDLYYSLALKYTPSDSADIYLQLAQSFEFRGMYDQATLLIQQAKDADPENRKYEAEFIRVLMYSGQIDMALFMNENYMNKYPDSDIPYLYLAMYQYNQGDTLAAVDNYERAVLKGTKPEVGRFLYQYFSQHGDQERADHYLQKAHEASVSYNPEKY